MTRAVEIFQSDESNDYRLSSTLLVWVSYKNKRSNLVNVLLLKEWVNTKKVNIEKSIVNADVVDVILSPKEPIVCILYEDYNHNYSVELFNAKVEGLIANDEANNLLNQSITEYNGYSRSIKMKFSPDGEKIILCSGFLTSKALRFVCFNIVSNIAQVFSLLPEFPANAISSFSFKISSFSEKKMLLQTSCIIRFADNPPILKKEIKVFDLDDFNLDCSLDSSAEGNLSVGRPNLLKIFDIKNCFGLYKPDYEITILFLQDFSQDCSYEQHILNLDAHFNQAFIKSDTSLERAKLESMRNNRQTQITCGLMLASDGQKFLIAASFLGYIHLFNCSKLSKAPLIADTEIKPCLEKRQFFSDVKIALSSDHTAAAIFQLIYKGENIQKGQRLSFSFYAYVVFVKILFDGDNEDNPYTIKKSRKIELFSDDFEIDRGNCYHSSLGPSGPPKYDQPNRDNIKSNVKFSDNDQNLFCHVSFSEYDNGNQAYLCHLPFCNF